MLSTVSNDSVTNYLSSPAYSEATATQTEAAVQLPYHNLKEPPHSFEST